MEALNDNPSLVEIDPNFEGVDQEDMPTINSPTFIDSAHENAPIPESDKKNASLKKGQRTKRKIQFIWDEDHITDTSLDTQAFLMQKTRLGTLNNAFLNELDWSSTKDSSFGTHWDRFQAFLSRNLDYIHNTLENTHPLLLAAKANSTDNPKWYEAVNGPYDDQFYDAMVEELTMLENIGAWTKVLKTKSMNVLKSTWAFKIKRYPSELVRKFKARFYVRGDMQTEGVDFDETYAPVVNWITVRTLLILSQ